MTTIARRGQDLWDVTIQNFGQIDNIFDLLADNPDLSLGQYLVSGHKVTVFNENKGNQINKKFFERTNFIVNNSDQEVLDVSGDFNNDFNNDFS